MTSPLFSLGAEIRLTGECGTCHAPVLKIIDNRHALVRHAYPHEAADGGSMYRCHCGDLIAESWKPRAEITPPPQPRLIMNGVEYANAGVSPDGETLWALPGGRIAGYGEITRTARLNGWKVEFVENKSRKK